MRNLVVVESPAKSKTVARYLKTSAKNADVERPQYEILATGGHVYQSEYVDVDDGFKLRYELIPEKKRNVDKIVSSMRKAQCLYLATDPDREGEAISAHVQDLLAKRGVLKNKPVHRVVFHEVTGEAVRNALENPGEVSRDLVQAQQSRDALDYLVGFNLSPLLIRKLRTAHLSAGRVQSPALRLIVERQREIERFQPQEYWTITATVNTTAIDNRQEVRSFEAELIQLNGDKLKKFDISDEKSAADALAAIRSDFKNHSGNLETSVLGIENKKRIRRPPPPFTTSTLMQEAARKLGMSARIAASTAQKLYEGLAVDGIQTGLITYTRTDSVSLSNQAIGQIRDYISQSMGENQLPPQARRYRTKSKNAQEAHEAIRPTNIFLTPKKAASSLSKIQLQLYSLIWKRAVACQMSDAIYDEVSVTLGTEKNRFRASGSTLRVPGWLEIYTKGDSSTPSGASQSLPSLSEGDRVLITDLSPQQHFTQPPPRYNTASLVKQLEEYGIGRPSTWPTIITKLLERNYVEMSKQNFIAKSLGCVVVDYLMEHFNRYVDYQFTSTLEDGLDAVARGETKRTELLGRFWEEFHSHVKEKESAPRFEISLGKDADSNRELLVRVKNGSSFLQLGRMDDEQGKPRFVTLPPDTDPGTTSLESAIEQFRKPVLPRSLGTTEDGLEIEVLTGRFGPYFSAKSADGQIERVSLDEGQDPFTITLEDVQSILKQPRLPRIVGTTENGDEIVARKGRFGPFLSVVSNDGTKTNVSLTKSDNPASVSLERAIELIEEAKKNPFKRQRQIIKQFKNSSLQILDGRFGPYVTDGKINATIPKDMIPDELELSTCQELIAHKAARKPVKRKRRTPARRSRSQS